ncbi:MAG: hypothetical protein J0I99_00480 [Devosia sp.]|uniref:hypothetical protein n=1 Tax=Devosia sp. TaxID=1871048 RepID=UPI001AC7A520|nr:hypothetical protein [Devosia sp.]MBN9310839.1 hypothetical protein [Devosia sp.]MBN9314192.1 hypothetical protein [Devosia sp.]
MQANPRIQELLRQLEDRGTSYRTLWTAKRSSDSRYDDVYMVAFNGTPRPSVGTAILLDYGPNGFGLFPESANMSIADDAEAIVEGPNGMALLVKDVLAFTEATDTPYSRIPLIDPGASDLRKKLINEEHQETIDAIDAGDPVETTDGLGDLVYVAVQAAIVYGLPLAQAWRLIQRSNMAKVDPTTGKVRRREDGKILKPDGWSPPDIDGLIRRSGAVMSTAMDVLTSIYGDDVESAEPHAARIAAAARQE